MENKITNYDAMMKEMTIEKLAIKNVQLVIVNGQEPFYVTTTGQLFNFNDRKAAIEFEMRYLSMEVPQQQTATTEEPAQEEPAE